LVGQHFYEAVGVAAGAGPAACFERKRAHFVGFARLSTMWLYSRIQVALGPVAAPATIRLNRQIAAPNLPGPVRGLGSRLASTPAYL
jgi:hypothetical protein